MALNARQNSVLEFLKAEFEAKNTPQNAPQGIPDGLKTIISAVKRRGERVAGHVGMFQERLSEHVLDDVAYLFNGIGELFSWVDRLENRVETPPKSLPESVQTIVPAPKAEEKPVPKTDIPPVPAVETTPQTAGIAVTSVVVGENWITPEGADNKFYVLRRKKKTIFKKAKDAGLAHGTPLFLKGGTSPVGKLKNDVAVEKAVEPAKPMPQKSAAQIVPAPKAEEKPVPKGAPKTADGHAAFHNGSNFVLCWINKTVFSAVYDQFKGWHLAGKDGQLSVSGKSGQLIQRLIGAQLKGFRFEDKETYFLSWKGTDGSERQAKFAVVGDTLKITKV